MPSAQIFTILDLIPENWQAAGQLVNPGAGNTITAERRFAIHSSSQKAGKPNWTVKFLLAYGAISPLLFIFMFLVQGVNRFGYNPIRHPVSSLSIGESGWMQTANFIMTGVLLLVFTIGLHLAMRPAGGALVGPALIGMVGIGLIGAGLFTADPLNGYPPGSPLVPEGRTLTGTLHDLFGIPVFLGLPLACLVFSRRFALHGDRGWAIYSLVAGLGMLLTFILAGLGFNQAPGFIAIAGVYQRLSIILGFTWIAMLAVYYLQP